MLEGAGGARGRDHGGQRDGHEREAQPELGAKGEAEVGEREEEGARHQGESAPEGEPVADGGREPAEDGQGQGEGRLEGPAHREVEPERLGGDAAEQNHRPLALPLVGQGAVEAREERGGQGEPQARPGVGQGAQRPRTERHRPERLSHLQAEVGGADARVRDGRGHEQAGDRRPVHAGAREHPEPTPGHHEHGRELRGQRRAESEAEEGPVPEGGPLRRGERGQDGEGGARGERRVHGGEAPVREEVRVERAREEGEPGRGSPRHAAREDEGGEEREGQPGRARHARGETEGLRSRSAPPRRRLLRGHVQQRHGCLGVEAVAAVALGDAGREQPLRPLEVHGLVVGPRLAPGREQRTGDGEHGRGQGRRAQHG